MANHAATAHASKKKKMGKVKGMHISLLSNGATSKMMHEPPDDSPYMGSQEGEETVHPSMAHLVKHVKSELGSHMGMTTGDGGAARTSGGAATQATSTPGPMGGNEEEDE